ncbi:NAD(P)/FAD-dependent oxidoreductase [Gemmobacter serpentinus]|uniref:NAD(P)/FAD-dependent oxidoreductase n=1 Tax=Gemmobacter serpentinus TaxID=2652247 RepID=UPI00124C53B4|nr:FAD-dependent oxidoreductase [Gemmobacter serpentinus]
MTEHHSSEIAVIGAGVIGMACALQLAQDGKRVVIVDPGQPGMGASYGNAGTIADYAVQPVGTPEVLKNLPSLLFDRNSPLSIRHAALPTLAPWLLRFARQSLPGPAARNAQAIAALVASANASWKGFATEIGAERLLRHEGCLYLYETAGAFRAAGKDMAARKALGITAELLRPDEIAAMEPGLPPLEGGAAFFPQAVFLSDPGAVMGLLAARLAALGVPHLTFAAQSLKRGPAGVTVEAPGWHLHARHVVLATGAHGRALALQAGDRVPLETERGYHVEWEMERPRLTRPACPTSRGFYLCPMTGRLRVAGTVELGGLTAPPSPHRINRLVKGAQAIFPDLGPPTRDWMGFRPSMPDSLPVISPSRAGRDVIHAYGHGHIGLTLAPITARIVADMIAGRQPELDVSPYRVTRF